MSRTKDPLVAERNQRLVDAVANTDDRFLSHHELKRKYNIPSVQVVNRVLADHGLSCKGRKGRPDTMSRRPISNLHLFLGGEIDAQYNKYALQGSMENRVGDLARILDVSPQRMSALIKGIDDVTLSELAKVSEWIKQPISEIISRCEVRLQASGSRSKPASIGF